MPLFIEGASGAGFNGNAVETKGLAIVGAGFHIEDTGFSRHLKTLPEQMGTDPGHALGSQFVEVHVGMEAAALFVMNARLFLRTDTVKVFRRGGKEAKCIEVTTADGAAADKCINGLLGDAQGQLFTVAYFTFFVASIDHGPFMHAKAAEAGGPLLHGAAKSECHFQAAVGGGAGLEVEWDAAGADETVALLPGLAHIEARSLELEGGKISCPRLIGQLTER